MSYPQFLWTTLWVSFGGILRGHRPVTRSKPFVRPQPTVGIHRACGHAGYAYGSSGQAVAPSWGAVVDGPQASPRQVSLSPMRPPALHTPDTLADLRRPHVVHSVHSPYDYYETINPPRNPPRVPCERPHTSPNINHESIAGWPGPNGGLMSSSMCLGSPPGAQKPSEEADCREVSC